jgi:hypothetical protein
MTMSSTHATKKLVLLTKSEDASAKRSKRGARRSLD